MTITNSKNMILTLIGTPPIAFHRIFATFAGSAAGGIWLSQLVYWMGKGVDEDGWIYKTKEEWTEETCLTRYEQESARLALKKLGVLEEKLAGIPARLHYKINFEILQLKLLDASETCASKGSLQYAENSKLVCGKQQTSMPKSTNKNVGNNKLACRKQQTNTETTAEITTAADAFVNQPEKQKSLVKIENEQDQILFNLLEKNVGVEKIEGTARLLIESGKQPYLSNIQKLLVPNKISSHKSHQPVVIQATVKNFDPVLRAAGLAAAKQIIQQ